MGREINPRKFAERLQERPYDTAYRDILRDLDAFEEQGADVDDGYAVFHATGSSRVTVIDVPHEEEFYVETDPETPRGDRLPADDLHWHATYTVDRGRSSPYDMIEDIVHLLGAAGFSYTPGTPPIAADHGTPETQYYTHATGESAVGLHPDRIVAVERGDGPLPALDGLDRISLETVGAEPPREEVEA